MAFDNNCKEVDRLEGSFFWIDTSTLIFLEMFQEADVYYCQCGDRCGNCAGDSGGDSGVCSPRQHLSQQLTVAVPCTAKNYCYRHLCTLSDLYRLFFYHITHYTCLQTKIWVLMCDI